MTACQWGVRLAEKSSPKKQVEKERAMSTAQELVRELEKLSPAERVKIIDRVIRDTIKPDVEVEKVWVQEAAERWNAFERSEVEAVPYDIVMAKYREKR